MIFDVIKLSKLMHETMNIEGTYRISTKSVFNKDLLK